MEYVTSKLTKKLSDIYMSRQIPTYLPHNMSSLIKVLIPIFIHILISLTVAFLTYYILS